MSKPVMAILRWDADPETALERYVRAVAAWRETFGEQSSGPVHAIAGRSDRGGLVVVNVFPTNGDHLAFGRNMGDPLAAVGLSTPDVEHVSVRSLGWPESADGEEAGISAARTSLHAIWRSQPGTDGTRLDGLLSGTPRATEGSMSPS